MNFVKTSINWVLILRLHLLINYIYISYLILKLLIWNSIYSRGTLSTYRIGSRAYIALSIESRELRFVLNKIILAVLHDNLIVKATQSNHSFTLWLCVFIGVFHLFFSLLHMRWTNRFDFAMKRTTEHIFSIFDIEAWSTWSLVSMTVLTSSVMRTILKLTHEHRIEILILVGMLVTSALIIKILRIFFVG